MDKEVWKLSDKGYLVSSWGRIKGKRGGIRALQSGKGGYLQFSTYSKGCYKTVKVHLIVATVFHGPPPEGLECRHLDGNKLNNRADNLKWGTKSENRMDTVRTNPHTGRRGGLTREHVAVIKLFLKNGEMTQKQMAEYFKVHPATIKGIKSGRVWKGVAPMSPEAVAAANAAE